MKHILASTSLALLAALLLPSLCLAQNVSVVGALTREAQLSPGERAEGKVVVRNVSPTTQRLRIYQTDYAFVAGGKTSYGAPGQSPRSNARWITIAPSALEIPVGGQDAVAYTIAVPNDAALVGTYWSVLMLEVLRDNDAAGGSTTGPHAGVRTVMRYGVQMITEIGNTGTREVKYAAATLSASSTQRLLRVDLANCGERDLMPAVWADLYDEKGVRAGRFAGGKVRIYPGCSTRFDIDISKVAPGKYKAVVVSDNGDDNVFGTQYQLEIR